MNRKGNERIMEKNYVTPYDMEGKLPLKQAIPLGLLELESVKLFL